MIFNWLSSCFWVLRLLYILILFFRKKKVVLKNGKSEMVVLVVFVKWRLFVKWMKWVNLFLVLVKYFFLLVEFFIKKVIWECIFFCKFFFCVFVFFIVDGLVVFGVMKWLRIMMGLKFIWFFVLKKYCMIKKFKEGCIVGRVCR